jgi:prepilin-type processing-associated H-X9-DG protein
MNANLYTENACLPTPRPTIWYPKPERFTQRSDQLVIFIDEGGGNYGLNDGNFKPIRNQDVMMMADIPQWYHNSKTNFGYFDGHVGPREYDEQVRDPYYPMWFPLEDEMDVVI